MITPARPRSMRFGPMALASMRSRSRPMGRDIPSGRRIARGCCTRGMEGFTFVNADGTGERRLTRNRPTFYESSPSWSPDGREVAFASGNNIYVVRLDGSQRRLTDSRVRRNGGPFFTPSWSPNGKWIAYVGYKPSHQGFFKLFLTSPTGNKHSHDHTTDPSAAALVCLVSLGRPYRL